MSLNDLEKLQELKEKGVLTPAEFEVQRKAILDDLSRSTSLPSRKVMPMMTAYRRYWQKSFVWSGRANRPEYWWPVLVNFFINIGITIVSSIVPFMAFLALLFGLATFFPGLAVYVRRFHDRGKSAWFAFVPLWAVLGFLLLVSMTDTLSTASGLGSVVMILGGLVITVISLVWFVFLCLPGNVGDNRYGSPQ